MLEILTKHDVLARECLIKKKVKASSLFEADFRKLDDSELIGNLRGWFGWGLVPEKIELKEHRFVQMIPGESKCFYTRILWPGTIKSEIGIREFKKIKNYAYTETYGECMAGSNTMECIKKVRKVDGPDWFLERTHSIRWFTNRTRVYLTCENGIWPALFPLCWLVASRVYTKETKQSDMLRVFQEIAKDGNQEFSKVIDFDFIEKILEKMLSKGDK